MREPGRAFLTLPHRPQSRWLPLDLLTREMNRAHVKNFHRLFSAKFYKAKPGRGGPVAGGTIPSGKPTVWSPQPLLFLPIFPIAGGSFFLEPERPLSETLVVVPKLILPARSLTPAELVTLLPQSLGEPHIPFLTTFLPSPPLFVASVNECCTSALGAKSPRQLILMGGA